MLTQQGLAVESKVGRTSLTASVKAQIAKDVWLLANSPRVKSVQWVFTRSEGQIGPTAPLAGALDKAAIPWFVEPLVEP